MAKRCSVKDCKAKQDKVSYHEIPSSIKRREKWKKALKPFLEKELDDKTLICSKHFRKSDYIPSVAGSRVILGKSAVPSIFLSSMPKKQQEVVVRPRHQSRRAASKEALKQMQILLEDENDAVEIPDDDEVIPIPVVVSPPKKKYKLTHRKSSDGNDREVLVLKSITPNITNHYVENNLELECWVEELEPCQKERNKKLEEEEKALQNKLDELVKACKGEVVYKGDLTTVIEVSEHVQKTIQAVQASLNKPPIVLNNTVANPQPGYQLVMDPRLGLIVGTVPSSNQTPAKGKIQVASNLQAPVTPTSQATPPGNRRSRAKKQTPVIQVPPPPSPVSTRSLPASRAGQSPVGTRSTPSVSTRSAPSSVSTRSAPQPIINTRSAPSPIATRSAPSPIATRSVLNTKQSNKRAAPQPPPTAPPATRSRRDDPTPPAPTPPSTRSRPGPVVNARPTETSVEGGLSTGTKPKAIVDLTSDDGRPLPDSREISFNKLQGKTFPSLVVVARPHLRVVDVNSDRAKLDAKVKSVLMYAPTKFTEWLIQQGLVKSEQKCSIHTSTQLKLGMYSDVSKFPYSGGYVWISECCPQRFVSVFSGSIFEGSPHPPLVILKILYHWSCQTNIQNVTQWVKVDNLYVKGMYTWLRSICTVALQTHIRQLGGPQTKVEVGVISLGTTSQDGNSRQVKVEVLGILETSSKLIRLRAIEPLADGDRNYKKRFSKILEPLAQWVHPSSIIVTDLTVDKATLHQMGFSTVVQTTSVDANNSNRTIMEYLRRIVPRMFQNTLSLLSRQIIQQFLDELVWREWFGTTSMQAFDNLIAHLAEQTRFESNQSLIVKLNRVALNPFKNWGVPAATSTTTVPAPAPSTTVKVADTAAKKRKRKEPEPPKPAPAPAPEVNRPPKSTSPDVPEQMVPLENYYYGTIDNYPPKTNVTLNMKCPFCKETFNNNIVLMNHLFKHAHNVSQDGQMCRYCLTSVPTANDLLKHISTSHPSETKHDNGFVCLICETQYMNPFVLGKHMSKEHCPSELPYQCGTCGYRCSNHKQAIDHFYKQHDNGPTIQCPFCLKSTTVFSSSRNISQNVHYFIQHLQKHQRKQYARRCGKCNLWFVQKDVLKEHQTKMHASQRGKTGLIPWIAPRNGVMVPKSKMDKYPCDAEGINFSTLFFNVSKNLKCKECDGLMETPKHFPSFESCQNPNCQYSTCCSNAMQEHNAKCNKNSQPNVPEEKLPYEMFCICGYSSEDGNQMAKHLTVCERKSAYPSLSDAKSASVTHSMLDVLGLVRKPEETEKKQTAFTRNIKKIVTKTESEPETVTLDEEEPTEKVVTKKIKKDDGSIETEEKSETTSTVSLDVGSSQRAFDKEAEGIKKVAKKISKEAAKIIKGSDEINRDCEEINKDSEEINEESEEINMETEEINKESEKINNESEEITKESEEINKASEEINKESEEINEESEEINKESKEINKESKEINKESEEIIKESEEINNDTEEINKDSEKINKNYEDVNKDSEEINKGSEEIIRDSEEINKHYGDVNKDSEEINKDSEEIIKNSEEINKDLEEINKDPEEIIKDSEEINEDCEEINKDSEEENKDSEDVNKEKNNSNELNEGTEKMRAESDDTNSELEILEKETNIADKETERTQPVKEKDASIRESRPTSVELVETLDVENEPQSLPQSPVTDMTDKLEPQDKEIEQTELNDDKGENLVSKEAEVEQFKVIDTEEVDPAAKDTIEQSQMMETGSNISSEEIEPKESDVIETENNDESSADAKVNQFHTQEIDDTQPKNTGIDADKSLGTSSEEKETENHNEIPQLLEAVEKSQPEDDHNSLDEITDKPADPTDMVIRDDDETNKEQERNAPANEVDVAEISKNLEDMSNIGSEASKDVNPDALEQKEVDKEPLNEFENISDKEENVSQLPEFSSPVGDISSTSGVYDDISESSDNPISKYLEDPEAALNLGDTEEAGRMEVEEADNQERILETMDYEDISNTGLDTLTSMDTD